jgi:SAM-dependent methyltransferase
VWRICYRGAVTPPAAPAPDPRAIQDWQRFWQDAGVDGCTATLPPAVAASISGGWQALLGCVPPTMRLLDVACGRGAILALARAQGFTDVCGVDLVAIDDGDPAITGGVDAAQLPFADQSFDIVTSQFGIEYAGLLNAGLEAARVARQHLWLLLHAAEGPIAAQAREQLDQMSWLRDEEDAFALIKAPDPARLQALRDRIVVRAETAENTTLLEGLWHSLGALAPGIAAGLVAELEAYATRLTTMAAAAPTADQTQNLRASLEGQGWQVEIRNEGQQPVARWLLATRR